MPVSKKLDDPETRARILAKIEAGQGRYEAAKGEGVSAGAFGAYYKLSSTFREDVAAAELACREPVLKTLREQAIAGDVNAAKEWLKHYSPSQPPPPTATVNVLNVGAGGEAAGISGEQSEMLSRVERLLNQAMGGTSAPAPIETTATPTEE